LDSDRDPGHRQMLQHPTPELSSKFTASVIPLKDKQADMQTTANFGGGN